MKIDMTHGVITALSVMVIVLHTSASTHVDSNAAANSEIMMPYTYGVRMQRQAKARNPDVPEPKLLTAQLLIVQSPSEPLIIDSEHGSRTIESSASGEFRVPFEDTLLTENPMVVFPTNAVSMGAFVFEAPVDPGISGSKKPENEQEH